MSLSPGRESDHTVNYQSIAGAFICFNHLTDQAFIWDQAFNSIDVHLLQGVAVEEKI